MVVKDDGEAERIFTAEKVAPVKKDGLDCSCSCWGASSCVVIAAPGSGKTFVLSEKIKNDIKELLDHHNRIIDHNTDGQYQCKQGQHVNGET